MMSASPNPTDEKLHDREAEAMRDLAATRFEWGSRNLILGLGLVLVIAGLRAGMLANSAEETLRSALQQLLPSCQALRALSSPLDLWGLIPYAAQTRKAEQILEDRSAARSTLRPRVQAFLTAGMRLGNEQVWVGFDGWLFFRNDWDFVFGRGFLRKSVGPISSGNVQARNDNPNPVGTIVDFSRQLRTFGVELVVLPIPVKPSLEGHRLTGSILPVFRQNASMVDWKERLKREGVEVLDPAEVLRQRGLRTGEPTYLKTDTHWRPEAMEEVAQWVAKRLRGRLSESGFTDGQFRREGAVEVEAHGDTLRLLGLPTEQTLFPRERAVIHPVLRGESVWRSDASGPLLLLGDSFTNIYSMQALGWGEAAGLAEQLSVELGTPIDVLSRNSDGAKAPREMLQRELAAGRDRLAGKKIVLWEFAARELSFGDWRRVEIRKEEAQAPTYFCPPQGVRERVRGTLAEIGPMPPAGTVPYREHIVALRLVDVDVERELKSDAHGPEIQGPRCCLVYAWSQRDQRPTAVASLRPGDRVVFDVLDWESVAPEMEKFQRSEIADPALAIEPATWGELLIESALGVHERERPLQKAPAK